MREVLILICCAVVSAAAGKSIRDIDWIEFSYPLLKTDGVPGDLRWMEPGAKPSVSLTDGRYVVPDNCADDKRLCASLTFDSVNYGALTGIESPVAAVVLTYHTGGTAHWQYVYLLTLESGKPRLMAWLRTGSRADQGLRDLSIIAGNLVLVVNDPEKRQGDCCSAGTITTRYRWSGTSFATVGQPVYKNHPRSLVAPKLRPWSRFSFAGA